MRKGWDKMLGVLVLLLFVIEPLALGQAGHRHPRAKTKPRRHSRLFRVDHSPGYLALIDRLRANGATVERSTEKVSQPFFSVKGRILKMHGESLQVFEYANIHVAESEAKRISSTGTSAGTSMAAWIAPPHFYRRGSLIVLYVGSNETILRQLIAVLSAQFAGS